VSVSFAIKLKALALIAVVLVDQSSQIVVIIATTNLHVWAFAAGMACDLMKPPNGRL
jgi:hypothetical protein